MMASMRGLLILVLIGPLFLHLQAADNPAQAAYDAWGQGRPAEAAQVLSRLAQDGGDWSVVFDAGLSAAAAGDHATATYWLLEAHRQRPRRSEPLTAMRRLGVALPNTWAEVVGPLLPFGSGVLGLVLLVLGGGLLGYGLASRRWPWWCRGGGLVLLLLALPGTLVPVLSEADQWVVATVETRLLDSTGTAIADGHIAAGTVLTRVGKQPWAGRELVTTQDGRRGWIAQQDCQLPVSDLKTIPSGELSNVRP